jgi:phytol kinase
MINFDLFSGEISLPYSLALILFYLALLILTAEGCNRLTTTNGEVTRKIVHIGAGNVVLLAWWLGIPQDIGVGAAIIAASIALLSYFVPILPSLNSVGRKSWGTFFYAVSFGVLFACFWRENPEFAALGILIMAWGDGLAAVVGQSFGKHPYQVWGAKKSLEGSLTMFGVSLIVAVLLLGITQGKSLAMGSIALGIACVATGLESFSFLGIDNLLVPLGSAGIAFLLVQSFPH